MWCVCRVFVDVCRVLWVFANAVGDYRVFVNAVCVCRVLWVFVNMVGVCRVFVCVCRVL